MRSSAKAPMRRRVTKRLSVHPDLPIKLSLLHPKTRSAPELARPETPTGGPAKPEHVRLGPIGPLSTRGGNPRAPGPRAAGVFLGESLPAWAQLRRIMRLLVP